jgi:hypothetical protein
MFARSLLAVAQVPRCICSPSLNAAQRCPTSHEAMKPLNSLPPRPQHSCQLQLRRRSAPLQPFASLGNHRDSRVRVDQCRNARRPPELWYSGPAASLHRSQSSVAYPRRPRCRGAAIGKETARKTGSYDRNTPRALVLALPGIEGPLPRRFRRSTLHILREPSRTPASALTGPASLDQSGRKQRESLRKARDRRELRRTCLSGAAAASDRTTLHPRHLEFARPGTRYHSVPRCRLP